MKVLAGPPRQASKREVIAGPPRQASKREVIDLHWLFNQGRLSSPSHFHDLLTCLPSL